jgi:Tfp pilus assembly protein PilF
LITSYEMLGQLYLSQNKLDQALNEFETLAKRQTKPTASLTMTGMILEQQGKKDLAKKRYEEVLTLDSSASTAGNNLAWILAESGEDLDRALDLARAATAATPDVPQVMDTLGWVYYKKRQPLLAIPLFQRSTQLDPANGWYHYHLGLAHDLAGDSARARSAFQQALKAGTNESTAAEIGKLLAKASASQ